MIRIPVLLVILLLGVVTGTALARGDNPGEDETSKIIIISFGFDDQRLWEKTTDIRYGHAPNIGHQAGNLSAVIRAENGTPLVNFTVWDPRYQVGNDGIHTTQKRGDAAGTEKKASNDPDKGTDLPIILPYNPDIRFVDLVDKDSGTVLVTVNISPALAVFQHRFPRDPDMKMMKAPLSIADETQQPVTTTTAAGSSGFTVMALLLVCGFILPGMRR